MGAHEYDALLEVRIGHSWHGDQQLAFEKIVAAFGAGISRTSHGVTLARGTIFAASPIRSIARAVRGPCAVPTEWRVQRSLRRAPGELQAPRTRNRRRQ
jgi:hypothetical protein